MVLLCAVVRFMAKTGWDREMNVVAHERALRVGLNFLLPRT
jgi:hypothetical protein